MVIKTTDIINLMTKSQFLVVFNKKCNHCIEELKTSFKTKEDHSFYFNKLTRYGCNIFFIDFDIIDKKMKSTIVEDGKFHFPTFLVHNGRGLVKVERKNVNSIVQPYITEYGY